MTTIGLSSNHLHTHQSLDGIGVYTQKLQQYMPQLSTIDLQLWAYPQSATTAKLINSHFWPQSFVVSTLLSLLTHKPCFSTKLQLFHSTDYYIPRLNCPVIATLHDAVPLQYPEWVSTRGRALKNFIMRRTAQWADGIITVSKSVVEDIVSHFKITSEKIHVIPSGIDESWLTTLPENLLMTVKQRYQLPDNYFLFVGTLQPRKNIGRLLQAFQLLPTEIKKTKKLVIVGRAGWRNETVLPVLQRLIQQQEVIWLDKVTDELSLRAIYQQADTFVFPSLYEGFGIPLLEAFASKIPVITSNTSALPEVAGEAAYLIDPTDIEALRYAMMDLTTDTTKRAYYQAAGFTRAQQRTWQACASETMAVYQQYL